MDEPIEETYFNWLYSKIASVAVPTPSLTYYTLIRDLHSTEFVWIVTGDDNRAADGMELRREFLHQAYLPQDPAWNNIPCSVLEMLIAFSRRASFQTDIPERDWFWIFMENLGLNELNDAMEDVTQITYDIMNDFVWRTYSYDGTGGLFPMHEPLQDQRKLELWYQFFEWLVDHDME